MGHTIPAKRQILYGKLAQLERFASTLRKPYRERLLMLAHGAYHHVSGMVYTNSLDDEEVLVYGMLAELTKQKGFEHARRVQRCLAILLTEESTTAQSL
jgi:tRNA G26 N,N-dimethylase Trm1